MHNRQDRTFTRRVVEFTANAHRACPNCGAPGQYLADCKWLETKYAKLYDPHKDGHGVGPVCPCCGKSRPAQVVTRRKRREWWIIRLPKWMTTVTQLIARKG